MNTSEIINKPIVLKLNANWLPISYCTIKQALIDMNGGNMGGTPPAMALDLVFEKNADGEWDFSNPVYMNPVKWDDWVKLEIRDYDIALHSAKLVTRAPTVIIAPNFSKMPVRTPRPTKDAIRKRDGGICQYTGEKVSWNDSDIDHVLPVSRGGKNTFANMVLCKKDVNRMKGNQLNHEVGLKLIRKPVEPMRVPVSAALTEVRHPTWAPFIINNK
jgi:5-methylcytosine-specific restriction endonuclease McrA